MPLHDLLTPEGARAALAALGLSLAPADVRLERRDGRWIARLPDRRLAWFAATIAGRAAMATERRVLRVLEARCRFAVPRVVAESADGDVDVRVMVPGADAPDGPDGPDAVLARLLGDPAAAARVGTALGQILAELHTRVTAADVAGWLPRRPAWPEPRAWVRDRLPRVVDDRVLHARADAVMARYEAALALAAEDDRALVHTDLGLHNVGVDLATWRVCGVFDWGDACWADRHLDFRHLVLDPARGELLDGVAAAYEAAAGRAVSRARVALYNAACAVGHLAFRAGVPPERRWCGRTLAEDLGWTRHALARAEAAGR